jgi:hypothetical protein
MNSYTNFNPNTAFDLILEITQGCKHSCTGCLVDTNGSLWPSEDDFGKLRGLVTDMVANGMRPSVLTLGPTDILSAGNLVECFTDPHIKAMADSFEELEIGCTFLSTGEQGYRHLAQLVDHLMPGKTVNFNVPFEINHLGNEKYIQGIKKRIAQFAGYLQSARLGEVQCQAQFDVGASDVPQDLIELFAAAKLTHIHDEQAAVFTLPHGRRDLNELMNRSNFIRSAQILADYQIGTVGVPEDEDRQIMELMYRNGKLYYRPFLVTEIVVLDRAFEVRGPWLFNQMVAFKQARMIGGFEDAMKHPLCNSCPQMGQCGERGIHQLQKLINFDGCLTALRKVSENVPSTGSRSALRPTARLNHRVSESL